DLADTKTQPEKDYDIMMVNMGNDPIVPDRPELEVMISSDAVPASLVDSGASIAVAGRGWLDRVEAELAKYGLKPIKMEAHLKFKGLGGTRRESMQKWIIPVGIGKKHALQEYFEIPGDMDGHWADFQELGVHGKELVKLPGGHAGLDLFDYDFESCESEPLFEKFRVDEMQLEPEAFLVAETLQEFELAFQVKDHADTWVAEALKNGSKGIFKKGTLKRTDKLMKEYSVVFDVLRDNQETFPWELFAKEEFRPLVDFSAKVLRAQAEGGRIGIRENPLTSRSWNEEPIMDLLRWLGDRPPPYEMVTLHQCMFGLTDDYGTPTRKRAPRADRKKLGIGDGVAKIQHQQTMRAVAREFKLRKDLIDVRVLRQNEAVPLPRGAVRRIYAMCTDRGVLTDFSDACADDPSFATVELATMCPTDRWSRSTWRSRRCRHPSPRQYPYLAADRKHSSQTIAKQTQCIEIYIAKVKTSAASLRISPRLSGALYLNLSHPSAHALKRRLKSYGVSQKVLDAVDKLDCVVCKELDRPNTTRSANLKLSTEFNENVLHYDAAKGHIAQRFGEIGEKVNILMGPVPAEAPQLKGRVERGIDFFKDHFQRLNRDVQLTKSDDPSVWTSVIASTRNNRIWRNGFTPCQYVLGRSPNVPASLTEAMEGDQRQPAAQSAALFEDGPRRAEQTRAAANWAFFELDSDDAVRRATVGRVRPPRGPFLPGQRVFYWREVTHVKSKRLQGEHGWRGPATVLAAEGHARLHLSCRGVPVLVTPEQVRLASRGEAETVENEDLARQLSQWRRKKGDGDSDNEDAAGDAPAAKAPRAEEMDMESETSKLKRHPEMGMICKMLRLTTHLCLMQLGRGVPRTETRLPSRALKQSRLPKIEGDEMDDEVLFRKELAGVEKADILPVRRVRTDNNGPTRGSLSYEQHPLKAKSRNIVPAYNEKQLLAGELQTTLTDTATAVITQAIGLIGTHIDDNLVAGSPEFFANQVAKLKKVHCYGKWQTAKVGFHHCGRFPKQNDNGTITCSQKRRKTKESKATAEERAMLHSGNGQIQWLVRFTRMDLAFQLVESQARAHDSDLKVQDLLDYDKLVSDAKTDHVDITFQKLDMDNVIVVAVGDSSHGDVGKTNTASQAGLVILLADNTDDQFLRRKPAKVTPMLWRSHRNKRVVRRTLAAETMAALEAVESGDMLRQHLVELHQGLGYRTHMDDVKAIKIVEVTDCKSLYDLLQKRGTVPSEKRLLIDIESLRNDIEFNSVVSKWVNTKQMLAGCLTKQDVRAGDYMRYVLWTGEYRLTEDPIAEQIISEQRMELKGRRGEYYRSKYSRRHRPADQPFVREGDTHFEDCIADLRYNPHAARPAPKHYLRWRMMLGQGEDDVYYEKLEDMVDWSGLDQVAKRRRIPTHVRKLLRIYAPPKGALERYEKDFTEKHSLKKTDMTKDIEHHEDANVISNEGDEHHNTDGTADLDDVKEIYMMDTAGAETEEIGGGAAGAGATLVVCAVCRMVVDQCECQPRTRKKANHNVPVPNDGDEWVEVPGETERSGGSTSRKKTTELPMNKARKLHERLKHASYKQVEHDLGDVLEGDIPEAYQLTVAGCSKCRRASCDTEKIPSG
ncbi:unnamed protein product, partial [Prorocentrum cordatum]